MAGKETLPSLACSHLGEVFGRAMPSGVLRGAKAPSQLHPTCDTTCTTPRVVDID